MNTLSVEYVPIGLITPYANNARMHRDDDISSIKSSIEQFGFNDPICVWGEQNIIVEGHGRLEAAKELGLEILPIIHLDHLSDEERKAYALAHNKTAELSSWDYYALESEIRELNMYDMKSIGFREEDTNIDGFDDLFRREKAEKEQKKQRIFCPHCNEWFEV